jgi:hypothetical protein
MNSFSPASEASIKMTAALTATLWLFNLAIDDQHF